MKILITTEWYKPVVNGVVTSVLNLEKGLREDGHDVRILTLSNSSKHCREGNVYYMSSLGAGKVYPNARIALPMNASLIDEIVDWQPDVIHSQCEFCTFIYAKEISRKTGAPIVHTYHTVYEGYTHYFCPNKLLGKKIVRIFSRKIASSSSRFIVPSSKIYDMLRGYNISAPMSVIPSGIELGGYLSDKSDERRRIRSKYGIGEDEMLLVSIGRIAREKNLDEILELMTDERSGNVRLMLVGDGPYREDTEEHVRKLGLSERVIFTGMVKQSEVKDYYSAGDIFVSASNSETQGLTYMEAMASGLPILCKKDECLNDVVDQGVNGYEYEDRAEFIEIFQALVASQTLRNNVGANARETMINKFSRESFAKACEKLYKECVA